MSSSEIQIANLLGRHAEYGKLEVIAAGRYHDWFERVNGIWRWPSRDYSLLDLDTGRAHHNRPGP